VNAATFLVYEDQFADVDGAAMMTAVRAAVRAHKFNTFPSVPEIWQEVEREKERVALTIHERANLLRGLKLRRHELEERSFGGEALADEFFALADEFFALGLEYTAVSIRERGQRYEGAR
jgi:hypothetical protein